MSEMLHALHRADMSRVQIARSGRLVPTKLQLKSTAREGTDAQRLAFGCSCPAVVPSTCTSFEGSRILIMHQGCRLMSTLER